MNKPSTQQQRTKTHWYDKKAAEVRRMLNFSYRWQTYEFLKREKAYLGDVLKVLWLVAKRFRSP